MFGVGTNEVATVDMAESSSEAQRNASNEGANESEANEASDASNKGANESEANEASDASNEGANEMWRIERHHVGSTVYTVRTRAIDPDRQGTFDIWPTINGSRGSADSDELVRLHARIRQLQDPSP